MAAERLDNTITLGQLLPGVPLSGVHALLPVVGLTLDSRKVYPGYVFCAMPGARSDGRAFLVQAANGGAVAVLAEARGFDSDRDAAGLSLPVIAVSDLASELSAIAGRFYGQPSRDLAVTGITGTNGKTTCSHLLAQLFACLGESAGVLGTLGYGAVGGVDTELTDTGMTTPDAIQTQKILAELRDEGLARVAMEVSSHSLDQGRVAAVNFDTAILTNLSHDHLDYHGDLDSYAAAKALLFRLPGVKTAVLNLDDDFGRRLTAQLPDGVRCLTYGMDNPEADLTATDLHFLPEGLSATVTGPWGEGHLRAALLGRYNLANLLAVIGAACAQGLDFQRVLAAVPALRPVRGRMEIITAPGAPRVVVDYAHTPDALAHSLDTLRRHGAGRLWCVFGCGGDRDAAKRPVMGAVAEAGADRIVVTSDNPRSEDPATIIDAIVAGMARPQAVETIADRRSAIARAIAEAASEDTVLIAGKGHETYQDIAGKRLTFDDAAEARLALAKRGGGT